MNKKIILMLGILMCLSFVIAEDTLFGSYVTGQNLTLTQNCGNCTFVNITSVSAPDGSSIITNVAMTQNNKLYTYVIDGNSLTQNGRYIVSGFGDPNGVNEVWSYDFEITPSGRTGISNIFFVLIIIIGIYSLALYSYNKDEVIISLFAGMFMLALGIYLVTSGLVIYRDWITNYFAYITQGIGAYISFMSAYYLYNQ